MAFRRPEPGTSLDLKWAAITNDLQTIALKRYNWTLQHNANNTSVSANRQQAAKGLIQDGALMLACNFVWLLEPMLNMSASQSDLSQAGAWNQSGLEVGSNQ